MNLSDSNSEEIKVMHEISEEIKVMHEIDEFLKRTYR